MAKRIIHSCDKCKKDSDVFSLQICVGRSYDGVEMADDYFQLDLCAKCSGYALHSLVKEKMSYSEAAKWAKNMTTKQTG